jgi:hypothetical protein
VQSFEVSEAKIGNYFFAPMGLTHTFINDSQEDFEVVALFSKDNPLPEVSFIYRHRVFS